MGELEHRLKEADRDGARFKLIATDGMFSMDGHVADLRTICDLADVISGKIAMLGIPAKPAMVDWTKVVFKMLTVKGVYGREMFETWHKMLAMLKSGLDVHKVITHRLPVTDFQAGFEVMQSGTSGKVVLDWASWSPSISPHDRGPPSEPSRRPKPPNGQSRVVNPSLSG